MKGLAVLPPDPWMEVNLIATLRQFYCDDLQVFHFPGGMGQLGSKSWRNKRDELNRDLVRLAQSLKSAGCLDFIFFIVYDDFLKIETAQQLRELKVPLINYHIDMVFQWYRVIRTAPYFDILAVAQMANTEYLKAYNPNIEWMPMAANPSFYYERTTGVSKYRYKVSFIGSFNPYRGAFLASCAERGITSDVFGKGWNGEGPNEYGFEWDLYKIWHDLRFYAAPRWRTEGFESMIGPIHRKYSRRTRLPAVVGISSHPPCENEVLPTIFRSSQVNLGFSDTGWHGKKRIVQSRKLQCRLRDFEVPMSGGFYLTQEAPDHRDYYRIGDEIETWSEPDELVDKIAFYIKHPLAAERIREAGRKRALESHTWQHRFDRLFRRLRSLNAVV